MKVYRLDKIVLRISNNAERFLNGLTSNALDRPRNAFTNQHGRIIATFDQIKTGEDQYLIVLDAAFQANLTSHVQKFLMLNKTLAEQTDFRVYLDLEKTYHAGQDEYVIPQKAGQMVLTHKELDVNVTEEEFTLFRLKNGIPLQGLDYQKDEFLLNVDEHEFVSYTKGCFLGQEPIAKVHNRAKPVRKLVVRAQDEVPAEDVSKMTSTLKDPQTGKTLGFVFVSNREG
jgi:folate-binding protein YgfZ